VSNAHRSEPNPVLASKLVSPAATEKLKAAAKRAADANPTLVKGNPVFHKVQRYRAYKEAEVQPELTQRKDLLEPLVRDGIVIKEDFLPPDQVKAMLDGAEGLIARVQAGEYKDRLFTVQPDIVVRIAPVDDLLPETLPFFESADIRSVVDAAVSPRAVPYRRELEHRFGIGKSAQADLYHFDNWRPIVKAFLYLDDVGPEQAPFVYLPGTHQPAEWRRRHERDFDTYGPTGPNGHFFPQEMRALNAKYGWEDVVCTGRAGTLILADLRGLHRGTPLQSGRRILLNQTFDLMNA
jgi:phytanoyl-CoA dioxygenase PhyH